MHSRPQTDRSLDSLTADALEQIRVHPHNADAWHLLGQHLLRNNMPKSARTAILESLQLSLKQTVSSHYDPLFRQELTPISIDNRLDFFIYLCSGKRVLHVGCCDFPLFNAATNLHLQLHRHCAVLDGLDTDAVGLAELARLAPGRYFSHVSDISEEYDLLLVPETIEHVANIQQFLADLATISFNCCLITAPNAFLPNDNGNYWTAEGRYIEHVHPDHNCWFSLATLQTCIRKFTGWQVDELVLLDNSSMAGCLCSPQATPA